MPNVTVVVPAYNEAPNLPELYRRLQTALDPLDESWDLLIVDDGSTDESPGVIRGLCDTHANVRAIVLARSFGQNNAIAAGIDVADTDAVVIMDADLQDPPEVIPEFVARWREGAKVVAGRRTRRHSTPMIKRALAYAYYRVMRRLVDWEIPADTAEFRLMDRTVVEALREIPQRHRLTRTLVAWLGFEQVIVDYEHAPRHAGEPKYSLRKSIRLAVTSITSFSLAPIRAAAVFGMGAAAFGAIVMAWWLLRYVQDQPTSTAALIVGSIWFVGGVQCFAVAIIGEYVARTYMETQHRPLYVVRERID
jgi:polyisoprenyl-phosphate glycosyltransferase